MDPFCRHGFVVVARWGTMLLLASCANSVSIRSFESDLSEIQSGQVVTLRWDVAYATSVSISPGVGSVSAAGQAIVRIDRSTNFVLLARNDSGFAQQNVFIRVVLPSVHGKLSDLRGLPIPGVVVNAVGHAGDATDPSGAFLFDEVPVPFDALVSLSGGWSSQNVVYRNVSSLEPQFVADGDQAPFVAAQLRGTIWALPGTADSGTAPAVSIYIVALDHAEMVARLASTSVPLRLAELVDFAPKELTDAALVMIEDEGGTCPLSYLGASVSNVQLQSNLTLDVGEIRLQPVRTAFANVAIEGALPSTGTVLDSFLYLDGGVALRVCSQPATGAVTTISIPEIPGTSYSVGVKIADSNGERTGVSRPLDLAVDSATLRLPEPLDINYPVDGGTLGPSDSIWFTSPFSSSICTSSLSSQGTSPSRKVLEIGTDSEVSLAWLSQRMDFALVGGQYILEVSCLRLDAGYDDAISSGLLAGALRKDVPTESAAATVRFELSR